MSYEAWRISFQLSEQAARSAYEQACSLGVDLDDALEAKSQYQVMLADMTERCHAAEKQRDELLAALEEIANDYADRFDMSSPSTNPGIKYVVKQARAAIASVKGGAAQAVSQGLNIDTAGIERDCCGTFFDSPHRSTCKKYRGKKGTPK